MCGTKRRTSLPSPNSKSFAERRNSTSKNALLPGNLINLVDSYVDNNQWSQFQIQRGAFYGDSNWGPQTSSVRCMPKCCMNYFISRRVVERALVNQRDVCLRQQVRKVVTPAVPVRAFWPTQRIQLDFIDCRNKHLVFPRGMQPGNWDCGTKSRTEYKVTYILVIVCVFSGYAWVRPVFNNSQWETCYEITKWANEFGWPQIMHTDNGTPFNTRMLVSLCRDHDVFLVHGRPYHPQSQGKVERLNRTLKNMVWKMQEDDALLPKQPWLQYLAHAVFVYNRTPHSKTGVAPFVAFYGRKPTGGMTFRGEWDMCTVERESHDIVYSRKTYASQEN